MATRKRKIKRLTKEQKKAVWDTPKENAGAGWHSIYDDPNRHDPRTLERGNQEE